MSEFTIYLILLLLNSVGKLFAKVTRMTVEPNYICTIRQMSNDKIDFMRTHTFSDVPVIHWWYCQLNVVVGKF